VSDPSPSNESPHGLERRQRRRGIYLLPNLFTTATLFAGFYGILAAMDGRFEPAALAVFAAMLADGIDGRVARLTNTQTDFGAEYDSLADLIAFGLAPALIMYLWALQPLGKLGWLAAFVYAAATALRLARFNTQVGVADKRYFQGLPSPSAAAIMAGSVWTATDLGFNGHALSVAALVVTMTAGLLMVSNVRYSSFKEVDFRGKVPFIALVALTLALAVILLHPPSVLLSIFFVYLLSGPVITWRAMRKLRGVATDRGKTS